MLKQHYIILLCLASLLSSHAKAAEEHTSNKKDPTVPSLQRQLLERNKGLKGKSSVNSSNKLPCFNRKRRSQMGTIDKLEPQNALEKLKQKALEYMDKLAENSRKEIRGATNELRDINEDLDVTIEDTKDTRKEIEQVSQQARKMTADTQELKKRAERISQQAREMTEDTRKTVQEHKQREQRRKKMVNSPQEELSPSIPSSTESSSRAAITHNNTYSYTDTASYWNWSTLGYGLFAIIIGALGVKFNIFNYFKKDS